jgi:hypothetical protein
MGAFEWASAGLFFCVFFVFVCYVFSICLGGGVVAIDRPVSGDAAQKEDENRNGPSTSR